MAERRIREVYADYQKGLISFDEVIRLSDEFLERYERNRMAADTSSAEPHAARSPRQEA